MFLHFLTSLIKLTLWLKFLNRQKAGGGHGGQGVLLCFSSSFIYCIQVQFPWRRRWHPTPVLLPGKSHGRRSLVGGSPQGHEESDTTERLHFHFSLSCIGEGNGNPLQCSCLESPRDRGAWWAAVYGVAQSRTRLKQLSSRSSQFPTFSSCVFLPCLSFSLCRSLKK